MTNASVLGNNLSVNIFMFSDHICHSILGIIATNYFVTATKFSVILRLTLYILFPKFLDCELLSSECYCQFFQELMKTKGMCIIVLMQMFLLLPR